MAYAPKYLDADEVSYTAGATITGGQLVAVATTAYTVSPTAGANASIVGVAAADAATGALVMVYSVGIHPLTASGSISVGDLVISAAAGKVSTSGAVSAAVDSEIVGRALTAATDGNPVDVLLTF